MRDFIDKLEHDLLKIGPMELTINQAAEVLKCHPQSLRRWADSGKIPCRRTGGGHRRFDLRDLVQFLKKTDQPTLEYR